MNGHIRQRSAGSWEVKLDLPRDPVTRARRTRTETVRGTKSAAQRRLRELLTEVDRGAIADAGRMTTGQWLEQWLAECRHTTSPKTHQERAGYVRSHLGPALGAIPLGKLSPAAIQRYYTAALTSGRLDGKGGLAPQTVAHHDRVLHTALERAKKLRLIAANPVDDVDPPRVERAPIVTLGPDAQARLLEVIADTELAVPILVALATGLRRGELLGLAWANVDLEADLLRVVQVIEETKAGTRIKPAPKTKKGRRTITLPAAAVDALRRYRVAQLEAHLRLGLGRPDLLFPRWAKSPAVFGTAFTRAAARAGITTNIHALRHTHVTDLLSAGVHPKVVSERAGHSSVAFTLDRYAHVLPGMQEAAAQQVDATLRAALRWQSGGNGRGEVG
jgi:integrase